MKKIFCLLILLLFFTCTDVYAANRINSINMDIYIDSNGTAHVKETWDVDANQDTEFYKAYYNLGASEFMNFKVTEGDYVYTNVIPWDTSASFSDKAYKNGINYVDDGLELCFGISNYGTKTYVLEYDITNFVDGLEDADVVYWTLWPQDFELDVDDIYIKIYADEAFADDLDVWGYGYQDGYAYVYDGYIELATAGSLQSDEYMVVLIKFPKGTFETTNTKVDKIFTDYLEMAEEGADAYAEDAYETYPKISYRDIIIDIILPIVVLWAGISVTFERLKKTNRLGVFDWKFNKGEDILSADVPFYRDIPFNKDIYKVYFLANLYNLTNSRSDLFGAVLLKWLKEGKIEIIKVDSSKRKRVETAIKFNNNFKSDYGFEMSLYEMMYAASKDGVLESNELNRWCKRNHSKILKWFDDVVRYETLLLFNNNEIDIVQEGIFKIEKHYIKTELYEDAKIVKGLKLFLLEFSRIDTREAIEVVNWEEYLMIAQILGIADKVSEQFKKLYPQLIETSSYSYDDIDFVRSTSDRGVSIASRAYYNENFSGSYSSRSSSYSSGGGGRSSRGGGGGSRGGSSGGRSGGGSR